VPPKETDTLIVMGPDQASFYEFLKARQEAGGRTVVILERRQKDRRAAERRTQRKARGERRAAERRARAPEAALALMSVLGFMILHRGGDRWTA
jgi:hypothetical protein